MHFDKDNIQEDASYRIVYPILDHLWKEYSQTLDEVVKNALREELDPRQGAEDVGDARGSFTRWLQQLRQTRLASENKTQLLISPVEHGDDEGFSSLMKELDNLIDLTYNLMRQKANSKDSKSLREVRQIYTDSCILRSAGDMLASIPLVPLPLPIPITFLLASACLVAESHSYTKSERGTEIDRQWMTSIRRLDGAIVFSGAPGLFRMEWIQCLIQFIQRNKLTETLKSGSLSASHLPTTLTTSNPTCQHSNPHSDSAATIDQIETTKHTSHTFTNQTIQTSTYPPFYANPVPILRSEPDLVTFLTRLSKSPFVIRGGVSHWPALGSSKSAYNEHYDDSDEIEDENQDQGDRFDEGNDKMDGKMERENGGEEYGKSESTHAWNSNAYLLSVAGKGRVVPVEIGKDYRVDGWTQEMMDWETFLRKIERSRSFTDHRFPRSSVKSTRSPNSDNYPNSSVPSVPPATNTASCADANINLNVDDNVEVDEPIVYLAQYSLFKQFPKLRDDIVVPDFVYYAPSSNYPNYMPPVTEDENDEGVIINAWLGPAGTVSPAHTDPYFNCYAQVVGRKTVWLTSPKFHEEMYPLPSDSGLSNTSSLDVFAMTASSYRDLERAGAQTQGQGSGGRQDRINTEAYPLFTKVAEEALAITLQPGDLLFFPPGWWHAMRSEEKSFSVSFWF